MATSLGTEQNVIAAPELQEENQQIKKAFTEALAEVNDWGKKHIENLYKLAPWKLAHSYNVGFTAYYLARNYFHYSSEEALKFLKIGIMHDLGFGYVEDAGKILNHEGMLSPDEFEEQKSHVEKSLTLKGMPDTAEYAYIKKVIRGHHQFQYASYPEKTDEEKRIDTGKEDPLYTDRKILALADHAEALTADGLSQRKYRNLSKEEKIHYAVFDMRHSRPDRRGEVIPTDFFTEEEAKAAVTAAQVVFNQESFFIQEYFPKPD